MVETTTKNYGWVKPEITKSPSTWGGFLNNDLDAIDALVFANQQAIVPIGSITMFAGATAPANWLLCNGAVYNNTSIPLLAPILANAYNAGTAAVAGTSSAVPNLSQRFPLGANASNPVGQIGGTFSYTISLANLPAHAHPIVDVAHNHTVNQSPHAHGITDVAHNHTINQTAHGHGDPGHIHGVTDPQHVHGASASIAGSFGYGIGASFPSPLVNTGNTGVSIAINPALTGISINLNSANLQAANANISLNASGTGLSGTAAINANVSLASSGTGLSTTQNAGSGAAISIVPVYTALSYIIRYQ